MFFKLGYCEIDESVLDFIVRVLLQFVDQHCLGMFLSLFEILVDCRDRLTVFETEICEGLIRMLLYLLSLDITVVKDYQHTVLRHVHIEFASPETGFLSTFEGCNRISCVPGFLAVPETAVCYNRYLMFFAHVLFPAGFTRGRKKHQACHGEDCKSVFHCHDMWFDSQMFYKCNYFIAVSAKKVNFAELCLKL